MLTSIDGRVAVDWLDPSDQGQKRKYACVSSFVAAVRPDTSLRYSCYSRYSRYAFKCHRVKIDGKVPPLLVFRSPRFYTARLTHLHRHERD